MKNFLRIGLLFSLFLVPTYATAKTIGEMAKDGYVVKAASAGPDGRMYIYLQRSDEVAECVARLQSGSFECEDLS